MLEQLTELRETHLSVYYMIKEMRKDTDEEPDEEIHRARSGKVLSAGAYVPVELAGTVIPAHGYVHQPRSFLNPVFWGFLWKLHHIGIISH